MQWVYQFIKLQKACQNQVCCNLSFHADLLQLVETTCSKLVANKLTQSTCNRFVVNNKLSQAMWTHPDIGLLKQVVARCQRTCCNLRVFGFCIKYQTSWSVERALENVQYLLVQSKYCCPAVFVRSKYNLTPKHKYIIEFSKQLAAPKFSKSICKHMTLYIVIKNWICTFNIIWNFVIVRATMCWNFIILFKKNKERLKIYGNALSPRDIDKDNSWRSLQSTITEKIAACTFSQDASAMSNENYGIKMTQDHVMMRNFRRMNKSTFCLTSYIHSLP